MAEYTENEHEIRMNSAKNQHNAAQAWMQPMSEEARTWMQTLLCSSRGCCFVFSVKDHFFHHLINLPTALQPAENDDIIGRWRWEDWVHPDDLVEMNHELAMLKNGVEGPFVIEVRMGRPEIGYTWYMNRGEVGWRPDGSAVLFGMLSEISEQKALQENYLESIHEYNSMDRMKAVFLANMTHELRTPLNGIVGSSKLLQMTHLSEDQKELTAAIDHSSRRMMRLVENVLLMTELESGSVRSRQESFMPKPFFSGVLDSAKKAYEHKDVVGKLLLDEDVPEWVSADKNNLTVVLGELLDNAYKHTAKGQVCLAVSFLKMEQRPGAVKKTDAGTLRIVVSDTGIGVEADVLKTILEPFQLTDDSFTRQYQGAGLGLSICKKLAKLMKATFAVESKKNEGSTFRVSLPVNLPLEEQKSEGFASRRILVMDEDDIGRTLLGLFCEHRGYRPDTAKNAYEAIALAQKEPYDLILIEVQGSDFNGFDTVNALRLLGYDGTPPVIIAVTSYLTRKRDGFFEKNGVDDYLQKPISLQLFEEVMKKHDF